jgi:hypothetical protein
MLELLSNVFGCLVINSQELREIGNRINAHQCIEFVGPIIN